MDNLGVVDGDALRTVAGKTCLVTGADGFMGSHLTEALVDAGANVHAFVRATSSGAVNNIVHGHDERNPIFRRWDARLLDGVHHIGASAGHHGGQRWAAS